MMAFNKDRVLKKAETLAGKGKIDGAIKEFKKILSKEGEDENILNRIGDLYKRIRKNDEAIQYWAKTSDLYENRGFYLKAIAVQKKIQRVDPGSLTSHRKLADLYHQQGLKNDARGHYQYLVDHYLRTSEGASAIAIYQKLIEIEPENPTHRAKLAELYKQQQLTSKAIDEYVEIARLMISHKELDQAVQVYSKAVEVDASDVAFLRKAVTSLRDAGSAGHAEELLNKAVSLNSDAEELRSLLEGGAAPDKERVPTQELLGRGLDDDVAPGVAQSLDEALPGANTGGFELIDTGQDDLVDSGMEVIQAGQSGFAEVESPEPPIHESIPPEQPPIAPPTLNTPIPSPSAASTEPSEEIDFDEFVIDFDDDQPSTLVEPPPDMAGSDEPGLALSGGFEMDDVEITLGGVAMDASAAQGEVASPAGPELTAPGGEMPFELDLEDDSFELGENDLAAFGLEGSQVVPPADSDAVSVTEESREFNLVESDGFEPAIDLADSSAINGDSVQELHEMDVDFAIEPSAEGSFAVEPEAPAAPEPVESFEPAPPPAEPMTLEPAAPAAAPSAEAQAPEFPFPDVQAPEAQAPEFPAPEVQAPEVQAPEFEAPEFEAPEFEAPEFQVPDQQPSDQQTLAPKALGDHETLAPGSVPAEAFAEAIQSEVEPPASDSASQAAMALVPDDIQKVNDLLAEAEVFVKYGLNEKAVDRLTEVLTMDPRHLGAATQLIRLQLERGEHQAVAPVFNDLYHEVQETGALELWDELKGSLLDHGYVLTGEQISQLPGGLGLDGVELQPVVEEVEPIEVGDAIEPIEDSAAAPVIEVQDIFEEPTQVTGSQSAGQPMAAEPAAPAAPEPVAQEPAAPAGGGGLIDLGELGSEIDAEISAELAEPPAPEAGAPEAEQPAVAPGLAAQVSSGAEAIDPLSMVEGTNGAPPAGDSLQPGLAWLNEAEPSAEETPEVQLKSDEDALFNDEDQFFDLAAELQSEMAPDAEISTPVGPEEQSLEEIVEGFKKGVAENLSSEDFDTHYNLGIAYREMMLLDEAIGEFQIAAKSNDYLVDCCAMLGLCFRDKGLPDLAMKWYQRAIDSGLIDEDRMLGMLYEMGSVYLERNDRESAYKTFVEIYGMNTNYRDVASKMADLAPVG